MAKSWKIQEQQQGKSGVAHWAFVKAKNRQIYNNIFPFQQHIQEWDFAEFLFLERIMTMFQELNNKKRYETLKH